MRVGIGYDVHQLCAGRPLVLGGITIPFERGLLGIQMLTCCFTRLWMPFWERWA